MSLVSVCINTYACARALHTVYFLFVCLVHNWCTRLTNSLRYIETVWVDHVCYGTEIIFRTLYSQKWQRSSHIRCGIVLFCFVSMVAITMCMSVCVCDFSVLLFYALYFIALMSAYPLYFISALCFYRPNELTQTELMIWLSCFDWKCIRYRFICVCACDALHRMYRVHYYVMWL